MGSAKIVFLVEDDTEIRESVRDAIEDEGYVVYAASDGASAIALLTSGLTPSVILVDLLMPGMDGWQFVRHLKSDAALSAIPVLVISAVVDAHIGDIQGVELMKKPIDLGRLLAKLEAWTHGGSADATL